MTETVELTVETPVRKTRKSTVVPRERILVAAANLFRKKGYKGTTVRDIAEAVGIQSGSLFHHFSTKEEMLLEIMREAFLSICIAHEKILTTEPDPVKQLRALIAEELDAILSDERRDYHAVLYFDWREAPEAALPELNRLRKRFKTCWLNALQGCADAGRLRCPPDIAEHIINGALRGVMTWFRKSGKYSTEEFSALFAHLFVE